MNIPSVAFEPGAAHACGPRGAGHLEHRKGALDKLAVADALAVGGTLAIPR